MKVLDVAEGQLQRGQNFDVQVDHTENIRMYFMYVHTYNMVAVCTS